MVRSCNYHFWTSKLKLKLLYEWRSVSQYVLMSGTPLELMTRFYFSLFLCQKIALLFVLGRPIWRKDGSVIYSANMSVVRVAEDSQPYITVSSETTGFPFCRLLGLEGITVEVFLPASTRGTPASRARFPYLYPPGTGWPSYTPGHWVPIFYLKLNSIGLFLSHMKLITSRLRAQQINAIYRFVTMVY
jgi:hypothetical protein